MKLRHKKIFFIVFILGVILFAANIVFAQVDVGLEEVGQEIALGGEDIRIIIARIIRIFLGLLGIIIVVLIMYGGLVWLTAAGDAKKVDKAKAIIRNAVIGLLVVLVSFSLSQFILTSLLEATTKPSEGVYVPPGGPGGGFGSNVFVVRSISPSGSVPIRNVTVRVIFNQAPDPATVEANIIVTKGGAPEAGTFVTSGSVVEFTPLAACPEPNEDRKCFDAETDYHVAAGANLRSRTGIALSCGGFAPSCAGDFHTGSLVDVSAPQVFVRNPAQNAILPQDTSINLEAETSDDSGVAYVEFYVDEVLVDVGASSGGTPRFLLASGIWNTTGVTLGAHEIKAKAFDIDANSAVSPSVFVNIRPAHCFDGVQNFDENGIDCGGDYCGVCTGSGCERDTDCSSGSCLGGVCVEMPIISDIDPRDGKAGNYITISGRYFGTVPGQVVFLGSEGTSDDQPAALADCQTAWQANQIVVAAPTGAVSGPIKIITAEFLEDATNDERGPVISDFVVNEIMRPGICGVNPSSGVRGDVFVVSGIQFGAAQGASQALLSDRSINPQIWSNSSITGIVPPVLAGNYPVRILASGQISNAVSFGVRSEETGIEPTISYLEPTSGAREDYITIYGSNFGLTPGLVIFKNNATSDEAYGATDFPAACGDDFWRTNSVTVKVPRFYTDGRTQTALGDYKVRVRRQDNAESAGADFKIVSGSPRPGLCAVKPTNGPAGRTVVVLIGEKFGTAAGRVKFYREQNASISSWGDTEISATVPVDSQTGPVKVLVGSMESNSVNFTVADCNASGCGAGEICCADGICIPETEQCAAGPRQGGYLWRFSTGVVPLVPRVVEECADGVSPSPSPWNARRGGSSVCVNAAVNARFSSEVDESTLNLTNVLVYKCVGGGEDPCLEVQEVGGDIRAWSQGFSFTPSANLAASSNYKVYLTTGIRGAGEGGGFMEENTEKCGEGFSYCFGFRTRDDATNCKLGRVIVDPDNYVAEEAEKVINYSASAIDKDDICIAINGGAYNWSWAVLEDGGGVSAKAVVTNGDADGNGRVDPAQSATAYFETIPDPPVKVTASVPSENRSAFGELVINFTDPRITEYWPNCDTACVNAEIGLETNIALDPRSLPDNLHLYKCANESCREIEAIPVTDITQVAETKTVVLGHSPLEASAYYRVIVDGGRNGIKSQSGAELVGANYGANYSWTFKTRDSSSACEIESVSLAPKTLTLKYMGEKAPLTVSAVGAPDDCNPNGQQLVAVDYDWDWSVADPNIVDIYKLGGSPLNVLPRRGGINCTTNCLHSGTLGLVPVCGNGRIEQGEDCDDGNASSGDGCSEKCLNEGSSSTCGNRTVNVGEDCDNPENPGCSDRCLNKGSSFGGSICGNGDIGDGEDCDDGNASSGDGCSANCLNEGSVKGPYPVCGNRLVEQGEDCDDGNLVNGDKCSNKCLKEGLNPCANPTALNCCGNRLAEGGEDCDDGNASSGDGCSSKCLNEGSNIKYNSVCGNGLPLQAGEECEFVTPDANIDPLQYVEAKKEGVTSVYSEAQSQSDEATVEVQCLCENDLMCAPPYVDEDGLGCGTDKCCAKAPQVEYSIPALGASDVCRNASIQIVFNQEMDQRSVSENAYIYKIVGGERVAAGITSKISFSTLEEIEGGELKKKTSMAFQLSGLLDASREYEVEIAAPASNTKGVKMKNRYVLNFTTGSAVCALDEVRLAPSQMYIFDFEEHQITAQGYTAKGGASEPIEPVPGVYAWEWQWILAATDIINFSGGSPAAGAIQNLLVPTEVQRGETSITAMASSTADTIFKKSFTKSASASITVLICENPWPSRTGRTWEPWVFEGSGGENLGFETFYCRSRGEANNASDDLPTINVVRVPTPPTPDILAEFLLTVNCPEGNPNCRQGDAIGIRINKNPEHYSPLAWYERQGFVGKPANATVDGFEALLDGRTAYVSAPYQHLSTISGSPIYTLYSNIYIVSYNENASAYVVEIYNQILSGIKFLANLDKSIQDRHVCRITGGDMPIGRQMIRCSKRSDCQKACLNDLGCAASHLDRTIYCDAKKTLLRRDLKRIAEIRDMEEQFYKFGKSNAKCSVSSSLSCMSDTECPSGETCAKTYPNLAAGTFISFITNSKWPSWQSTLGNSLGYALPEDPLNEFSAPCPTEYNSLTCFNAASSTFYCPNASKFYAYRGQPDSKRFTLMFNLEYTELSPLLEPQVADKWAPDGDSSNPIPRLYPDENYVLEANLGCYNNVISAASGRCGDGIVGKDSTGKDEACELGQTRIMPCGTNSYRQDICSSDCMSWQKGTCSPVRCGDGIVQYKEACDDGSLNGKYGRCNLTCARIGPHCGDGALQVGYEECDLGLLNGAYDSGCSVECKIDGPRCGDKVLQEAYEVCDTDTPQISSEDCPESQVKSIRCGGPQITGRELEFLCTDSLSTICLHPSGCILITSDTIYECGQCYYASIVPKTGLPYTNYYTYRCDVADIPCQWGGWELASCAYPGACGNGVKEGVEQCDDGNRVDTDGCLNSCVPARCGDGYVREGIEMCDLGSRNGAVCSAPYGGSCVYCSSACQSITKTGAYCGDGTADSPYEECDPGMYCTVGHRNTCGYDCRKTQPIVCEAVFTLP